MLLPPTCAPPAVSLPATYSASEPEEPAGELKKAERGESDTVPVRTSGSGLVRTGDTAPKSQPREGNTGRKLKALRVSVELYAAAAADGVGDGVAIAVVLPDTAPDNDPEGVALGATLPVNVLDNTPEDDADGKDDGDGPVDADADGDSEVDARTVASVPEKVNVTDADGDGDGDGDGLLDADGDGNDDSDTRAIATVAEGDGDCDADAARDDDTNALAVLLALKLTLSLAVNDAEVAPEGDAGAEGGPDAVALTLTLSLGAPEGDAAEDCEADAVGDSDRDELGEPLVLPLAEADTDAVTDEVAHSVAASEGEGVLLWDARCVPSRELRDVGEKGAEAAADGDALAEGDGNEVVLELELKLLASDAVGEEVGCRHVYSGVKTEPRLTYGSTSAP